MARVTLQTIADEIGVSRMTVSNAFSKPDQLSTELRARILQAADRLGYSGPDPVARALARGRSGLIGVILTESPSDAFTDEVTMGFLGAVAQALQPAGLSLALLDASGRGEIDPTQNVPMDAAVLYSCIPQIEAVATLRRRGIPVVAVDETLVDDLPAVNVDDRGGARSAARHLLDLGHRRIAIVASHVEAADGVPLSRVLTDPTNHVMVERLRGWGDALREEDVDATVVGLPDVDHDDARALTTRLLERPDRPTAILAYSDVVAAGVARGVVDARLGVPDDVSIVGFDDSPLAARHVPALTTVRQDLRAKGEATVQAVRAVMEADRKGGARPVQRIVLPTDLVVRESTAPPRSP